jgi:type IV pilus assembly protein PilM
MWDFSRKKSAALGVDIGSGTAKLLQLRRRGRGYCVEHCAIRRLPTGAVEEKRIMDAAAVGAVLQEALHEMAPPRSRAARRAVVAVPGSSVIVRQLEFDAALSDAELELQASAAAERHIPFAPGEIALDFARLDSPGQSATSTPVLLAACRKEHVDGRVAALVSAGIEAAVVEIETQAVERAFALLGDAAGLVALADIGLGGFSLYVLRDGEVIHQREQTVAQARYSSLDSQPIIPEQDLRERIAQLSRALQVFYSSSAYHGVDRIVLAGGGAVQPGLAAWVESVLRMPVALANPLAAMSCGTDLDAARLAQEGPVLFLAVGLALRGLRDD